MISEALKISLTLTISGSAFTIPGGDVLGCKLDLREKGFDGSVMFRVYSDSTKDSLLEKFTTLNLIDISLSVAGVFNRPNPAPAALSVSGIVTQKSVREFNFQDMPGNPVLYRHYEVHFRDGASVLWEQHFPTSLFTETTLQNVINAQLVTGITFDTANSDWSELTRSMPMACLGLGAGQNHASFYDFLMWLVDVRAGYWSYDYTGKKHRLTNSRPAATGDTAYLDPTQVQSVKIVIPETRRHGARVLNSYAQSPQTQTVTQTYAITGLNRDVLMRSAISSDVDSRKTVETSRLGTRGPNVEVFFNGYPTVLIQPGIAAGLNADKWKSTLYPVGKSYCVSRVVLDVKVAGASEKDRGAAYTGYEGTMEALLTPAGGPAPPPSYNPPFYPVLVEGKVVSSLGQEGDRTYSITTDQQSSLDFYQVNVPLWGLKVNAPYEPIFMVGHCYFPAYRDCRVLLALYYDRAEIVRFLDWGANVRLPADGQGNQILFGKNDKSFTAFKHDYVDNKPVLTVKRIAGKDVGSITVSDGCITIEAKEDSSLPE